MKITKELIISLAASYLRRALYVSLGVAGAWVNLHPQIFGKNVNWQDNGELISNTALVIATLIVNHYSDRKTVRGVKKIEVLTEENAIIQQAKTDVAKDRA